jgi:hypothetical protein
MNGIWRAGTFFPCRLAWLFLAAEVLECFAAGGLQPMGGRGEAGFPQSSLSAQVSALLTRRPRPVAGTGRKLVQTRPFFIKDIVSFSRKTRPSVNSFSRER